MAERDSFAKAFSLQAPKPKTAPAPASAESVPGCPGTVDRRHNWVVYQQQNAPLTSDLVSTGIGVTTLTTLAVCCPDCGSKKNLE